MYLLVLALPFLSTIISSLFGHFLGGKITGKITTTCIGLTFLTSFYIFYEVALLKKTCFN